MTPTTTRSLCRQDALHQRREPRNRACDRHARRARRRECRGRGEEHHRKPENPWHDLHRRSRDRSGGRTGARHPLRHSLRGSGGGGGRSGRLMLWRDRHPGQQRQRHRSARDRRARDEALRSDASDQRARNLSVLQGGAAASAPIRQSAHSHAVAAAGSKPEVVFSQPRLHNVEIWDEPRDARPRTGSRAPTASRRIRCGRRRRSRRPPSAIFWAATNCCAGRESPRSSRTPRTPFWFVQQRVAAAISSSTSAFWRKKA